MLWKEVNNNVQWIYYITTYLKILNVKEIMKDIINVLYEHIKCWDLIPVSIFREMFPLSGGGHILGK